MPEGEIVFELPEGLTKEAVDKALDERYDNPVASRILEAARAQLANPDEWRVTVTIGSG